MIEEIESEFRFQSQSEKHLAVEEHLELMEGLIKMQLTFSSFRHIKLH